MASLTFSSKVSALPLGYNEELGLITTLSPVINRQLYRTGFATADEYEAFTGKKIADFAKKAHLPSAFQDAGKCDNPELLRECINEILDAHPYEEELNVEVKKAEYILNPAKYIKNRIKMIQLVNQRAYEKMIDAMQEGRAVQKLSIKETKEYGDSIFKTHRAALMRQVESKYPINADGMYIKAAKSAK